MKKRIPIQIGDVAPVSRRLKLAFTGIALAVALTLAAAAQMFFSSFEHTVAVKGTDPDRDRSTAQSR
jgi:hypothetical protein